MHTGRRYTLWEFFAWTVRDTLFILAIAAFPTVLYEVFEWKFIAIPWQPVALLGTALAFVVGFKNNASYGRIWEARQIYGAVINDSRSFGFTLRDAAGGKSSALVKEMFYRHFAWLTALRYQLREPKTWENTGRKSNQQFKKGRYVIPEWESKLEDELTKYMDQGELEYILLKKNRASQLLASQSQKLAELKQQGIINDFQWVELQNAVTRLIDDQGKAERIKNFPYPRNFSSVTTYLMFVFIFLLPFGLLEEYDKLGQGTLLEGHTIWFNVLFSGIVGWAFHILDTIGESAVNPFEGSANDIPITQISRMIEIDLRDMLDESDLPAAIASSHNILM